jgi:tetrahydromethanopterin S-methyltransferase subunit G
VEARLDAVEKRLDAVEARLDAVETRLDTMDEKIDMVEYHLSKEIQVTYQTVLENKKGIEILSNHFEEGKRYMVGESHKIAELSVRFDEFQRKCAGA